MQHIDSKRNITKRSYNKKVEQIEMSDLVMKRKDKKKNELHIKEKEKEI